MDGLIAYALSKKYADEVGRSIVDAGFKTQVEQDRSILQTAGQEKILYFIPKTVASPSDGYDEYVYSNNAWEPVGATDVDLSSYATKAEVGDLSNLPTTDKSSIVSAISETFTSVSNGKSLVASAITDKGVSTSSDATFEIMAQNIEAIPTGSPTVSNPALVLWDWEGTKLAEYSREDALALTVLPMPSTLIPYAGIDHELLVFQNWTHNLLEIKAWVQSHYNAALDVNAIYTTSDALNHNYWGGPRLDDIKKINKQKRGSFVLNDGEFSNCRQLTSVSIPEGTIFINSNAFNGCWNLTHIGIPKSATTINSHAFANCYALNKIVLPNSITDINASSFNGCYALKDVELPAALTVIGESLFNGCRSLNKIAIPKNVISILSSAFYNCTALCDILLESLPTLANTVAFASLATNYYIYVPRENLSWFETETNWSTIYAQGHIVAIEDHIQYLESIGFNVEAYKGAV